MENTEVMQDITIVCKDCGQEFTWTVGEQNFYKEKGLENRPVRCKDCRNKKRANFERRENSENNE